MRREMRWLEYGAKLAAVGVVYFLSGKLGLSLASINASASPVWPPTGIAIAAMVLFGYRMWPAVFAGAFLFNLATGSPTTSFLIGVGNTLEGLAGAWAVNRFAGGRAAFRTPKETLAFAMLACGAAPLISATIGVTTLTAFGLAPYNLFSAIWTTWYLGDATGAILVAPLIILWAQRPKIEWSAQEAMEAALLLLATFAIGALVFSSAYPTAYIAMPILLWAALRFGARETITVSTILNGFAVVATSQDRGPFALGDANQSLLTLQGYVAITTLIALFLAIVVTQRKESEEGLRRSRDTLESSVAERTSELQSNVSILNATLESTTDGLLVVDRGGRIERYNRQFVEMWNLPQDIMDTRDDSKAIDAVLSQLATPDDFVAKVKALHADPKADSFDVLHFKDGRVFERYSKPQRLGSDIVGRVWSFRDVTERRRAEDLLRGVLENSTDVIYVMDRAGRFLLANPAFAAMFGRRVEEIIGKADLPWVPADVQAAGKKDDDRVYAADKPMTSEYTLPAAGMLRTFHTLKAPFRDASGNVIGILGVVRDITDRKQVEEQRIQVAAQLEENRRLQELDELKTQFLNSASHELRTPLTPIRLELHLLKLQAKDLSPSAQKSVASLDRNLERLARLVEGILEGSRAQSAGVGLNKTQADLAEIARNAVETFQAGAKERGIDLTVEAQAAPAKIDADRVTQVVYNFLSNALKFTAEGGRVMVAVTAGTDHVRVEVRDTGSGVPPDRQSQLFRPFSQLHEEPGLRKTGTGLGLFISKGIVELHGGTIGCTSEGAGRGSTFFFTIPTPQRPSPSGSASG